MKDGKGWPDDEYHKYLLPADKVKKPKKKSNGRRRFLDFAYKIFPRCQWCNAPILKRGAATCDHVHPLHHGGSHKWDNLAICCGPCNTLKSNHFWGRPRYGPKSWIDPLTNSVV
jgi:5-methylcytosine-specific restriction endonuclease McrA